MNTPETLEHDTLQDDPSGAPVKPARAEGRDDAAAGENADGSDSQAAPRGRRPWCAFDNPLIWTVTAGERDDE